MFDFGNSLLTMDPDEQKKMLANRTPGQRKSALEMGIGFKNQNQRQQQRQQKRDAHHDLTRLNQIVEKENEAHDFFGKGLSDWQKNVTGRQPSKDTTNLMNQFDDYEHFVLASVPKGGTRHAALVESLPKIKDGFLKQGHQFALDKLNERSRSVLDKGLQRIAKGALGAKDGGGVQAHDDAAFDLINKFVLSEATFDEKDADVMYDKYLGYAGVDLEKARAGKREEVPGAKPGFRMEDAEMLAKNDTGNASNAGGQERKVQPVQDEQSHKEGEKSQKEKLYEQYFDNDGAAIIPESSYQYFSNENASQPADNLGKLSEKYETGGRGVGTVSSGKGDPGGVSYGLYQMASRDHKTGEFGGTVKHYVESDEFVWKKEFEGLEAGSKEFSDKWKELSAKHPEEFRKSQHAFIKETHYKPTVTALKDKVGLDVDEGSATLRDVIWSTGVQHNGPELVGAAAKRVGKNTKYMDRASSEYERKVIEAIYDERATRCKRCPANQKKGYDHRMVLEKQEALELFDKELGRVKDDKK